MEVYRLVCINYRDYVPIPFITFNVPLVVVHIARGLNAVQCIGCALRVRSHCGATPGINFTPNNHKLQSRYEEKDKPLDTSSRGGREIGMGNDVFQLYLVFEYLL